MTDLDLKKLIGAALMVPPTDNWHYPLSENQLRHLITQAVEAEREACALMAESMRPNGGRAWDDAQRECFSALTDLAAAIRARGGK
jgi:hypothetical protein